MSVALSPAERLALAVYGLVMRWARPLLRRKLARRARSEPGYSWDVPGRFGRYATPEAWQGRDDPGVVSTFDPSRVSSPVIWLHAVSLGETRAAAVLLPYLREAIPAMRLLLTHSTATGREEGLRHLMPGDAQAWLPWDDPDAVHRFLRHFQPAVGVLMETEVWPCLVAGCRALGVPLALANARMNERSWRGGQRLAWLSRPAYAGLSAVLPQTEDDARRLGSLGAAIQRVPGNIKFDARPDPFQVSRGLQWRQQWGGAVVMLASSRAGEELAFIQQISNLLHDGNGKYAAKIDKKIGPVRWLIVPRHPQRFEEVAGLIEAEGWHCERRSRWGDQGPPRVAHVTSAHQTIWLGDSLGEMPLYFSLADVSLLGGSFEPLGGQNLIEAAACGCPQVLGPHTFNFAQAADQALAQGAARRVTDMAEGLRVALDCLNRPEELRAMAKAAEGFALSQQGAAETTAKVVADLLNPRPECAGQV